MSLLQIDVEVRKGICKLDISEPFIELILHGTLDAQRIHTLLILCVIRSFRVFRNVDPVDDIASPTMVKFGIERQLTGVVEDVLVRSSERCCPCFLGLKSCITELVSGIVIEVSESG